MSELFPAESENETDLHMERLANVAEELGKFDK